MTDTHKGPQPLPELEPAVLPDPAGQTEDELLPLGIQQELKSFIDGLNGTYDITALLNSEKHAELVKKLALLQIAKLRNASREDGESIVYVLNVMDEDYGMLIREPGVAIGLASLYVEERLKQEIPELSKSLGTDSAKATSTAINPYDNTVESRRSGIVTNGFGPSTTINGETRLSVKKIEVNDPYLARISMQFRVDSMIDNWQNEVNLKRAYDEFYDPSLRPALCSWRDEHMGTALALAILYRPGSDTLGIGIRAEDHPALAGLDEYLARPVDQASREAFTHTMDGRGIRSRSAVMQQLVEEHLLHTEVGDDGFNVLSLACGAAIPIYDLADKLQQRGLKTNMTLVDRDPVALGFAQAYGEKNGLPVPIICQHDLLRLSAEELLTAQGQKFDVVEMLGLFEYLPDRLATELLRKAASVVKPDGLIVFGNMVKGRPQEKFFKEVIRWRPKVRIRSEQEMLSLVEGALGATTTEFWLPDDGVYAVVGVHTAEQQRDKVNGVTETIGGLAISAS